MLTTATGSSDGVQKVDLKEVSATIGECICREVYLPQFLAMPNQKQVVDQKLRGKIGVANVQVTTANRLMIHPSAKLL